MNMIQTTPKASAVRISMVDVQAAIPAIRNFVSPQQLNVMGSGCRGEEREYFKAAILDLARTLETMPQTYEQDGKGDQAIAYLHYFKGGMDWFITERDSDPDGEGQVQTFGLADIGQGAELGYISISELLANNVDLDLHFAPVTLAEIKARRS